MGLCTLTLRIGFLAFFALNAWNTLNSTDAHISNFKQNFKNFETTIHTRFGIQFPEFLRHANVHKNSEFIVKFIAWSQLALAAASLLVWGGFTCWVGVLYFLQQMIHLNFANISVKTTFTELEHIALAFGLMLASFGISECCGSSWQCKSSNQSSVASDRGSQAQAKRQH